MKPLPPVLQRPHRHAAGLLPLAVAMLLSACASQQAPAPVAEQKPLTAEPVITLTAPPAEPVELETLRAVASQQERLDRVAAPLLLSNPELCKSYARNLLGFIPKTRYSYSAEYVKAAQALFGLGERLQVVGVLAGSGAARAGLRKGDILLSAEDKPLPTGPNAETAVGEILGPLTASRASVRLAISRDGAQQELVVPLTRACPFRVDLGNADNVNTYADGQRILVTRGILDFTRSDNEIAYLIAREMAHNALSHAAKQRSNSVVATQINNLRRIHPDTGMLIGMAGIKPTPPELDAAADSLAMYMLARAGFSLDQAIPFWQRLASQYPATVLNGHTALHPATAARVTAMEKAIKEVKAKQAAKKPLLP